MISVMVTKVRTRNPKSCVPRELIICQFNAANLANSTDILYPVVTECTYF